MESQALWNVDLFAYDWVLVKRNGKDSEDRPVEKTMLWVLWD